MWHFSTYKSIETIEKIHKRCLTLTLNDYKSDYKILLDKTCNESIRRIKTLAIEIFKTVNDLNPFLHITILTIFTYKTNSRV